MSAPTILYDNLKSVVIDRDKYSKGNHSFNNDFLALSKGRFTPKLCQPYYAQTQGKVERFNHYLKANFYVGLKSSLKGSGVVISHQLLNSHIFAWLEYANGRIHLSTLQRPKDMLEDELVCLSPIYLNNKPTTSKSSSDVGKIENSISTIAKIDISYQTTIDDYEAILGGAYATS